MIINRVNKRLNEEKFVDEYVKRLEKTIDRLDKEAAQMFQKANNQGVWDPVELGKYNRKLKLRKEIRNTIKEWKNNFKYNLVNDLTAEYKDQFGVMKEFIIEKGGAVESAFNRLPKRALSKIVLNDVEIKGKTLTSYLDKFSTDFAFRVEQELFEGIALGVNPRETSSRIMKAGDISKRRARTTVRSWYNAILNEADDDVMRQAGVPEKIYSATLDLRTTALCASRDGKTYKIDEAPPLPAHPS